MKNKSFFVSFTLILAGCAGAIASTNYYFDYYGIFRGAQREVVQWGEPNGRFIKTEYLLTDENFKKYDSYLWGSSRVMKMDTSLTGQKTYNFGVSNGLTEDCLIQFNELLKHGARPKTVYLGLDDISYLQQYDVIRNAFNWPAYPDSIKQRMEIYIGNLMRVSTLGRIMESQPENEHSKLFLRLNGMLLIPDSVEARIEEEPEAYVGEDKFHDVVPRKTDDKEFHRALKNIREIKKLCDKHGIQFIPFFNPQHMTTYLADDIELMNRFKKELVKISPFWDFSGVNYVTANNYFWYETSHPRAFICDKILDTVSGQNQITWVPDFGVYVTPENVDAFCEKAVRDRAAYDPNHEQWIPSPEERKIMTKRVNY